MAKKREKTGKKWARNGLKKVGPITDSWETHGRRWSIRLLGTLLLLHLPLLHRPGVRLEPVRTTIADTLGRMQPRSPAITVRLIAGTLGRMQPRRQQSRGSLPAAASQADPPSSSAAPRRSRRSLPAICLRLNRCWKDPKMPNQNPAQIWHHMLACYGLAGCIIC